MKEEDGMSFPALPLGTLVILGVAGDPSLQPTQCLSHPWLAGEEMPRPLGGEESFWMLVVAEP